jgi:glyoxylase-like metal-dependent hydrolase (beta-lactamase superfamily II)
MSDYPIDRWRVGDVTVTKVVECVQKWPFEALLPGASEDVVGSLEWLAPYVHHDGRMLISFHAFVVESQGRTILVDTCIGNDKDRTVGVFAQQQSNFLVDLAEAGVGADDVDIVFCTHLHVDHVGWNTSLVDGRWVPTFPQARHLFHRGEYEFWRTEPQNIGDVFGDSVAPVMEAGLADLVDDGHRITDDVVLEPTVGHTPGHCSVRIESGGQRAVITGDMTHHPVQLARPDLCSSADWDEVRAEATRREAFERWGGDTLVLGTHFASPTAGRLEPDGDAWRLVS